MKQKKLTSIVTLTVALLVSGSLNSSNTVTPYFSIRSQGFNNARKVAGQAGYVHLCDECEDYGLDYVTLEYSRTFRSLDIARCLFGDKINCCKQFKIQGLNPSTTREDNAFVADYFYLPSDYQSTVQVCPTISNLILDFNFYFGLDEWVHKADCFKCFNNTYFRLYFPFVHTMWDLNFCEFIECKGINSHDAGYFTPDTLDRSALLPSAEAFFNGQTIGDNGIITQDITCITPGGEVAIYEQDFIFHPLRFAKMRKCKLTADKLAEIRFEFGWDFCCEEDKHLGVNLHLAAPAGTRPTSCYLFSPVVGNGKHWELGAGLTGHWLFWDACEYEEHMGLYLDLTINHMFKTRQQRTFDLCHKNLSRYMLAARYDRPIEKDLQAQVENAGPVEPSDQFKFEYQPVANLTTVDVKISNSVQADLVLWLNYTNRCFSLDLGYDFWVRTCEKISCEHSCIDPCDRRQPNLCTSAHDQRVWGLKGASRMFGFYDEVGNNITVPLSATMSNATVCNASLTGGNSTIDNPYPALSDSNALCATPNTVDCMIPINTSLDPVLLTCDDIDFNVRTRGLSNKFWTHLSCVCEQECFTTHIGVGGQVEFGRNDKCFEKTYDDQFCKNCIDCALTQWGIWVKAGISY